MAVAFAREGAHVAIAYLSHHDDARETVALVAREGRRAIALAGDASEEAFARDAVAATLREFGKLDILVRRGCPRSAVCDAAYVLMRGFLPRVQVNHVGAQTVRESIRDISAAQLRETFAVNVYSMCTPREACCACSSSTILTRFPRTLASQFS